MIPEHTQIEIKIVAEAFTKGFTHITIHPTKDSIVIWQGNFRSFALNGFLITEILRVMQQSVEDILIQSFYNGSVYVIALGAKGALTADEIAFLIYTDLVKVNSTNTFPKTKH
jgi:hypothetical protein